MYALTPPEDGEWSSARCFIKKKMEIGWEMGLMYRKEELERQLV